MSENDIRINEMLSIPLSELSFRTSRSGGPGGQNVNKVESRVELLFDVRNSTSLSRGARKKISARLKNRIDSNGTLHLSSQSSRSQWENKENTISEFTRLLRAALKPVKKRIPTHPSRAAKEERLRKKKMLSEKKGSRRSRHDE